MQWLVSTNTAQHEPKFQTDMIKVAKAVFFGRLSDHPLTPIWHDAIFYLVEGFQ